MSEHQPAHLLTVQEDNVPRPGGANNWTERLVGGTFMRGRHPRHGWVSVYDRDNEFDNPLTGLSGTIVNAPHVSTADLPFLHPFGNDFEFHVAPDAPFFDLLAPDMEGSYKDSTDRANDEFGLAVPGVIGMEMDGGLVPGEFEPRQGDRVAMWGRLIVDAGHDDFHTEIHPPLLMAAAHQGRSAQQPAGTVDFDATTVYLTSRPYLVSQEFDHGGLFNHLLVQVGEGLANPFSTIDAHPRLMPQPFVGLNSMIFQVRPPSPRRNPGDRLILDASITQRSRGVVFLALPDPRTKDALQVLVLFNEAGYVVPPDPPRQDDNISLEELIGPLSVGGTLLAALIGNPLTVPPTLALVIAKGFATTRFSEPRAVSAGHAPSRTRLPIGELRGNFPSNRDDRQPFPLFGALRLEWEREGVAPGKPHDLPEHADDRPNPPPRPPRRRPRPIPGSGPGARPQEP